jgi:hypothetical protein
LPQQCCFHRIVQHLHTCLPISVVTSCSVRHRVSIQGLASAAGGSNATSGSNQRAANGQVAGLLAVACACQHPVLALASIHFTLRLPHLWRKVPG